MSDNSMLKTVETKSGFKCKVDVSAMDDMRLVESIVTLKRTGNDFDKLAAVLDLIEIMIGPKQKEQLYKHLEKVEGRARATSFEREVTEIFEALQDSKKN